jgi:hypothetical protein
VVLSFSFSQPFLDGFFAVKNELANLHSWRSEPVQVPAVERFSRPTEGFGELFTSKVVGERILIFGGHSVLQPENWSHYKTCDARLIDDRAKRGKIYF